MKALAGLGRVTVVGCGKMGEAIVAGLEHVDGFDSARISVLEHTLKRCDILSQRYGIKATATPSEAFPADTLIVALKPQVAREVLAELVQTCALDGVLVVSIAAGLTTEILEDILPDTCPVVRVMPNTPLLVQAGTSTVSGGSRANKADVDLVCELFASMGSAIELEEADQDASCALNGSGPAYFARVCTALAVAGESEGLSHEVAMKLALETMYGTAVLLREGDMDSEELVDAVSSPGGTTIAALDAMEAAGLSTALANGVSAAVRRSKELAK